MKAVKYTLNIEIEVLSLDTVGGLLYELAEVMSNENIQGNLEKNDGDSIRWGTISESVEF